MGPIVFHALFSLVQGMNIGYRPYAFGPVGGTGHVGSRVLKGVILHGCFRPVPRFRHGQPRKGRFSVNTSILPPLDVRLPFPPMRMCSNGPPRSCSSSSDVKLAMALATMSRCTAPWMPAYWRGLLFSSKMRLLCLMDSRISGILWLMLPGVS